MPLPSDPLAWAVSALQTRGNAYAKYQRYLDGNHELSFATEKFRTAFGRLFTSFAYNRCGTVVDAHADRLRVTGFGADDDPLAQAAQDIWDANDMDVREGMVEAEAFGMGDGYVIVEQHPQTSAVLIWPQRAAQVRVHYADDEPGRIDLALRSWRGEDKRIHLNLYYPDRIEKYRTPNPIQSGTVTSPKSFERFRPEDTDLGWPVKLPITDTVPVFHFANNGRVNSYGESELGPVISLQDGLNKTLMDMMVTMEFAAFPQRVLINVDTDDPAAADNITRFQAGIDRLLTLFGSSDGATPTISEFSAANIAQYLDVAESWDVRISRVTKIPVHYLTQESTGASGRAKRMDESPFTAKIQDRQRAFGSVWAAVLRYALRLSGQDVAPGALRVNWQDAAPLSIEDQLDTALQQQAVGIPDEQIWKELGYEPDQIAAMQAMKQQAANRAMAAFERGDIAVTADG